jgi:hypothetical protein
MLDFLSSPLVLLAAGPLLLLSLASPFLVAIGLVLAVALSPELPLDLPLRLGDFVLPWALFIVLLQPGAQANRKLGGGSLQPSRLPNVAPWLVLLVVESVATMLGTLQGTTRLDLSVYSGAIFLAKSVETFLLYLVAVRLLNTPARLRAFPWLLLLGGAALASYGAFDMLTGRSYVPGVVVDIEGGPSYSLIALALLPPLALGAALGLTGKGRQRWLAALPLAPVGYAFLFTLSRQAYFGAAAMLAVMLWLRQRRYFWGGVLLLALVLWGFPQVIPAAVTKRTETLVDPFTGQAVANQGVYSSRTNAWLRRFPEMWDTNPITGLGLAARPPGYLDSQYLVVLYYTGFVGLLVFLNLLLAFGRLAWRVYSTAPEPLGRALGLAGLGAIVGFAVAGWGGSPFVAIRAREMFWLLMAAVAAYSQQLERTQSENLIDQSRLPARYARRGRAVLPLPGAADAGRYAGAYGPAGRSRRL